MKKYHYRPSFNWRVYGAAEKQADKYWKERLSAIKKKDGKRI